MNNFETKIINRPEQLAKTLIHAFPKTKTKNDDPTLFFSDYNFSPTRIFNHEMKFASSYNFITVFFGKFCLGSLFDDLMAGMDKYQTPNQAG